MSSIRVLSISGSIICLSFGVHSLTEGNYGLATFQIGFAALNFYLAITGK
jgi:hypothetical protein